MHCGILINMSYSSTGTSIGATESLVGGVLTFFVGAIKELVQ
mgnify:CR=1 FL=1